jgi:methyl-accepting chemotaxis protein
MKFSLRKKVLILTILPVVIVGTILSFISIVTMKQRGDQSIDTYRATLLSERKQALKGHVEMALRVIENLPPDEAKKVTASMKYGTDGYIWIHDYNNMMLVHPSPALQGKSQVDLKDPNGVYIVREMTKTCREKGEVFLNYVWKRPGKEESAPKLSYAKAIPSRSWIVGTGLYVDDIDLAVSKELVRVKEEVGRSALIYSSTTAVVSLILCGCVLWGTRRYISGSLEEITVSLQGFGNDLTRRVPVTSNDEVAELAIWINNYIQRLHEIIIMISAATTKIHTNSGAIASSLDQQSGFATQLSSSVVEISSTMEEFSSTASQIAQHSQSVVDRADKTLEDTKQGANEVETLTMKISDISHDIQNNMDEIVALGRTSKEINKVMEIINTIASQTKLIAFNAALEAAGAGEAGKRFGVVAVEIRRLADSVVESTGEIEGKITAILDSVNRLVMSSEKSAAMTREGEEYASNTLSMLIEIVDGVEETTTAARQISLSTQQQQIASSQVLLALRDIEQGVRHSGDTVHTLNDVTLELAEMAEKLNELVQTFKLGDNNVAAVDVPGRRS